MYRFAESHGKTLAGISDDTALAAIYPARVLIEEPGTVWPTSGCAK